MSLPTYSTGTVSVTAGGTVVTGVGTIWSGINAKQGDFISINSQPAVLVTEVTDTTHLTIPPWSGANQSAVSYILYQNYVGRVVGVAAAEDVADMLERLRGLGPIFAVPAGETAPDPSYGTDGQYAYQQESNTWWLKSSGVWVVSSAPVKGYGGTSTSSVTIGTGSKSFTMTAGMAYVAGSRVRAVVSTDATKWLEGNVTSYDSSTGAMVINSDTTAGSGTFASWTFTLAGATGGLATTGGTMTGNITFSDDGEGVNLSRGGRLYDENTGGTSNLGRSVVLANNDSFELLNEAATQTIVTARFADTGPTFKGNLIHHAGVAISNANKSSLLGAASGTVATGAVATADANLLLYNTSSTNWAGIGTDTSGNLWFKVGTSGTPVPAMYLNASTQAVTFAVSPIAPTPTTTDSSTKVATTAFVQAVKAASVAGQFAPTNPSAITSASAVMLGLGSTVKITPASTGRLLVVIQGQHNNSIATGDCSSQMKYGTGTAPAFNAAATGTNGDTAMSGRSATAGAAVIFGHHAIITGLTIGTQVWFDLAASVTSGGNGTFANISSSIMEF